MLELNVKVSEWNAAFTVGVWFLLWCRHPATKANAANAANAAHSQQDFKLSAAAGVRAAHEADGLWIPSISFSMNPFLIKILNIIFSSISNVSSVSNISSCFCLIAVFVHKIKNIWIWRGRKDDYFPALFVASWTDLFHLIDWKEKTHINSFMLVKQMFC